MATKTSHNISGATTNATLVKNAPGVIYGYEIGNNSATADAYVKLYDSATIPTAGAGTPVRVIYVPKASRVNLTGSDGILFINGIGMTITGALADADTTATAATQVVVSLEYR